MVVGSQLQDKIHERKGGADVHGVSGSYPVVSKAMQLAVCADPWCSRRDILCCYEYSQTPTPDGWVGGVVNHIEVMRPPHTHLRLCDDVDNHSCDGRGRHFL